MVEIAQAGSVSEESARGIVEWHGKRAMDIARTALVSAELRAPICPHTSHHRCRGRGGVSQRMRGNSGRCSAAARAGCARDRAGPIPAAAKLLCVSAPSSAGTSKLWARTWNASRWNAQRFVRRSSRSCGAGSRGRLIHGGVVPTSAKSSVSSEIIPSTLQFTKRCTRSGWFTVQTNIFLPASRSSRTRSSLTNL